LHELLIEQVTRAVPVATRVPQESLKSPLWPRALLGYHRLRQWQRPDAELDRLQAPAVDPFEIPPIDIRLTHSFFYAASGPQSFAEGGQKGAASDSGVPVVR